MDNGLRNSRFIRPSEPKKRTIVSEEKKQKIMEEGDIFVVLSPRKLSFASHNVPAEPNSAGAVSLVLAYDMSVGPTSITVY